MSSYSLHVLPREKVCVSVVYVVCRKEVVESSSYFILFVFLRCSRGDVVLNKYFWFELDIYLCSYSSGEGECVEFVAPCLSELIYTLKSPDGREHIHFYLPLKPSPRCEYICGRRYSSLCHALKSLSCKVLLLFIAKVEKIHLTLYPIHHLHRIVYPKKICSFSEEERKTCWYFNCSFLNRVFSQNESEYV